MLRSSLPGQTGFEEAVRSVINLATAQFRQDAPNLLCRKVLVKVLTAQGVLWYRGGCPAVVEENIVCAAMITDSEMMLDWSAEQVTEITMLAVEEEIGPVATDVDRRVPNLEEVRQQRHTVLMATRGRKSNFLRSIFLREDARFMNCIETWKSYVSRCERKLREGATK